MTVCVILFMLIFNVNMLNVNYLLEIKKYKLKIQRPLWDSNRDFCGMLLATYHTDPSFCWYYAVHIPYYRSSKLSIPVVVHFATNVVVLI